MKFCKQCDKKISLDAKFCESCGEKFFDREKSINIKIEHSNMTTEKVLNGLSNGTVSILKGFIQPVLILSLLAGLIVGTIAGGGYYYSEFYLGPQYELDGVKLTHTKGDIRLIKGFPDEETAGIWEYKRGNDFRTYIYFRDNNVQKILSSGGGRLQDNSTIGEFFSVLGFKRRSYRNNSYDELIKRLGKPSYDSADSNDTKDTIYRRLFYDEYNIKFDLRVNRVIDISLYDKKYPVRR